MPKCLYCPEEGTQCICLACRTKLERLEAENVRLKKDIAYLRSLNARTRAETRASIHRKMKGKP
jgi:hypothetical protein